MGKPSDRSSRKCSTLYDPSSLPRSCPPHNPCTALADSEGPGTSLFRNLVSKWDMVFEA